MDDLIQEFVAETNESLDRLDADLVILEQSPDDAGLIANIFRVLHTIKGTSGFLGLPRLMAVAHKGEDVLGLFRDKKLIVTPEYITLILEALDRIKAILTVIGATGEEPAGSDAPLIAKLEAVYNDGKGPDTGDSSQKPPLYPPLTEVGEEGSCLTGVEEKDAALLEKEEEKDSLIEIQESSSLPPLPPPQTKNTPSENSATAAKQEVQTLRVNVQLLEDLMTMISELVLTRNQLLQISRQQGDGAFCAPLQNLNHVVSSLQEGVMKTRMQPIGNAWQKLPRIVRDVAAELGKSIDLQMFGQDTELDRQILEMIKDPLTHMVRNSADHGIETPAERLAVGKPRTGIVTLSAYHQGGHIIVEISDDGKGLPMAKIKDKIVAQGLATPDQLAAMPLHKIQQFIFHAGLSTAEKVTSVSGRGVGMDVVRTNIEKIGGSVEMSSEEGHGTTFTIKIPLTLAIVSALIVGTKGQRFAIPQIAISELVLAGPDTPNPIEDVGGARVLRLRGKLLPLVSLADLLHLPQVEGMDQEHHYVVITRAGPTLFGLIVDDVYDLEEIVIKPLSAPLKSLSIFSGNTILGDGCVIMILDPAGVLKAAEVGEEMGAKEQEEEGKSHITADETQAMLLLFRGGDSTLKAAPLESVARLEDVRAGDIAQAAGRPALPYLGQLLPVESLSGSVEVGDNADARRPLIILRHDGRTAGLLVEEILDVVSHKGILHTQGIGGIIADSILIEGTPADVIDVAALTVRGIDWAKGDTQAYG